MPGLYSDDKERLLKQVAEVAGSAKDLENEDTERLKDILYETIQDRKSAIIDQQVRDLKDYKEYNDVMTTFEDIKSNLFYDTPLMLEWNTWRAMTMLDGGDIKANLKLDDKGQPSALAVI